MPEPQISEERGTREASVDLLASSSSDFIASCLTCPGAKRTPTLHISCELHSDQLRKDRVKGIEVEADAEVGTVKLNPSTANLGVKQDKESLTSCSTQIKGARLEHLILGGSRLERRPTGVVIRDEVVFYQSDPGPSSLKSEVSVSSILNGKHKAEDEEEGSETPAKTNQMALIVDPDEAAKAYYEQNEIKVFEDQPDQGETSAGERVCMILLGSNDPFSVPIAPRVEAPPFVAAFTMNFGPEGGINPFQDEIDPDEVPELLNLLMDHHI